MPSESLYGSCVHHKIEAGCPASIPQSSSTMPIGLFGVDPVVASCSRRNESDPVVVYADNEEGRSKTGLSQFNLSSHCGCFVEVE